jgi:hypothetical protein
VLYQKTGNRRDDYLYYWTGLGAVLRREIDTSIAIGFAGRIEFSVTEAESKLIRDQASARSRLKEAY